LQFIWSGVGGGVIVLLALFAALTAYLCARHNHRRRAGGGSPYLPLYDEEVRGASPQSLFMSERTLVPCART
jgi:hypothetical protein